MNLPRIVVQPIGAPLSIVMTNADGTRLVITGIVNREHAELIAKALTVLGSQAEILPAVEHEVMHAIVGEVMSQAATMEVLAKAAAK